MEEKNANVPSQSKVVTAQFHCLGESDFSSTFRRFFKTTTEAEWNRAVEILKPEYISDDEGYIVGENSTSHLLCYTLLFGWIAIPISQDNNDPNRILIRKALGNDNLCPLIINPIRFRYKFSVLGDFAIIKTQLEAKEAFKKTMKGESPMYLRADVIAERDRNKAEEKIKTASE